MNIQTNSLLNNFLASTRTSDKIHIDQLSVVANQLAPNYFTKRQLWIYKKLESIKVLPFKNLNNVFIMARAAPKRPAFVRGKKNGKFKLERLYIH